LEDQGEQRKKSDYDSHIGSEFVAKKKLLYRVFADKPLLVCPIAKNLGPMQLYMFAIRIKSRNRAIFAERAAAAEGAGLIRSTSAIISIRGTKAAKRALHRLGSERRLLGQTPYSGHRRDSPNFEIAQRSNVRLASRNINEMQLLPSRPNPGRATG